MMTSPTNEAACLLEKGALYSRREGLQWEGRDLVFAGFKQGAFSLYFGDAPIYHFDLEGRWQRAYMLDRHFIKRLDGAVHEVDRVRENGALVMKRRVLGAAEARRIDEELRTVAVSLLTDLSQDSGCRIDPPDDKARPIGEADLREFLGRIARWDAAAWDNFKQRHTQAYGPLPLVPPDCPNAVVVQATVGDRDGRSFAAGPVNEHIVRTPEQFEEHVRGVAGLLGRRLLQSRSAYLAGVDVLRLPGPDVLAYLDILQRNLQSEGEHVVDDVHAFLDDFQSPVADAATLRSAFRRRLTRIALGIESGAPELRRLYGKDWSDADLQAFAAEAKAAGIELSVMVLVGVGGRTRSAEHVERTGRLIESLLLTRGDIVFLMDEREIAAPGAPNAWEPLDAEEWRRQLEQLRQGLSSLRDRGVKVVPYSMVKQSS
ncbi:hypothetical protein [Paludisphaera rhizosphaerae]|uniref:hypothetical protein n=1 Tax=Paludisphaera rhizosphaerae TaxID=2711216 RepID=UPI0013EBAE89|nr:hypothetical protein [Paludisphaera rhizosphaerae]